MTLLTLLSQQGAEPPVIAPRYFGGAAWVWPKSRRDRRYLDDAPADEPTSVAPVVEVQRAKITPAPKFDVAGAIAAAREAARNAASEEVALRRAERRLAAVATAQARAAANAQALAIAKAIADDEDDIETLLLGAF
jgi:hypothetical protein